MKKLGEKEKMFKKIFKFITGYVIIEIRGSGTEQFINMCVCNKLGISEVIPIEGGVCALLMKNDFFKIRRLVRKSGVRVAIKSKHGLRIFLKSHRKRYGFVVAGLIFCIFMILAPQYIWCVEIDGAYGADTKHIEEILKRHGVYVGAKKSEISELSEIKSDIVSQAEGVNWAWLYMDGTRARLQIQEELPIPNVYDTDTPTDIVAVTDGWVRSAYVLNGERRINAGMNVTEGQLLVSGKVALFREGEPEKYIHVHSRAKIIADTVRCETGFFTDKETLRIKTGNKKECITVTLFGKELNLFKNISCGFKEYDIKTKRHDLDILGYTGISVSVHTVHEINVTEHELAEKEIIARAKEKLEERICKKLLPGAVKTDEELTYSAVNGIYRVQLRMHLRENIGMEIPAKE